MIQTYFILWRIFTGVPKETLTNQSQNNYQENKQPQRQVKLPQSDNKDVQNPNRYTKGVYKERKQPNRSNKS